MNWRWRLTIDELIGEISEGKANVLPVGAETFVPNERKNILIVAHGGKEKMYLVQLSE